MTDSSLPLGFKFPFYERLVWDRCCKALIEQGFLKMERTKHVMTRAEAIASLQKHCPVDDPAAIIDFYIEAGMLEIKEEEKRKPIDWRKATQIITNDGTFRVMNMGLDGVGKQVVHIMDMPISVKRRIDHEYFNPDESGYVVEFDRWIENY